MSQHDIAGSRTRIISPPPFRALAMLSGGLRTCLSEWVGATECNNDGSVRGGHHPCHVRHVSHSRAEVCRRLLQHMQLHTPSAPSPHHAVSAMPAQCS